MDNPNKLYVGNLPYTLTRDDLMKLFAQYGEVVDAVIIMDKMSGRSKGFGFVEFATPEAATEAVEKMNGYDLEGRKLVVNVARPQKPRE